MTKTLAPDSLGELIERGGIYYDLPGNTVREILEALVAAVPKGSAALEQNLLPAILEREALMSTGIGHGVAIPHPRNPLAAGPEEQFVALAFPKHPADWNALDGKPVDTILLVVSSSAKSHLRTLSGITFFCQQEAFLKLLRERAPREVLLNFIKDTERQWQG